MDLIAPPSPPTPSIHCLRTNFLTTFYYDYNPPLNTVQLMVSKVLVFHENIDLLHSDECCDTSTGNSDPSEHIMLVLVGIPVSNQLGCVELSK